MVMLLKLSSFSYLGSIVEGCGGVALEVDARITRAARVFGPLQRPVFCDGLLSLMTKRMVYQVVVLGVPFYAVETWPIKQRDVCSLESFHHRRLQSILCISSTQQIVQHVSNDTVQVKIGLPTPLADMIASHRLCWLDHLARMNELCLPKQLLFGWLPSPHPSHGLKLCWHDKVRRDLKHFGIDGLLLQSGAVCV